MAANDSAGGCEIVHLGARRTAHEREALRLRALGYRLSLKARLALGDRAPADRGRRRADATTIRLSDGGRTLSG